MVELADHIVQAATRGDAGTSRGIGRTNKRKARQEQRERGKPCKRRDKKVSVTRKRKEGDNFKDAFHLGKDVWVTSLTEETSQSKPKRARTEESIEEGEGEKATIAEQEDVDMVKGQDWCLKREKTGLHIDFRRDSQLPMENTIEEEIESSEEEEADEMRGGSKLLVDEVPEVDEFPEVNEVPEIDDEFCTDLVPEIEDEFWDGGITTQNKRKEVTTTWIDSFGIPCNLCAFISYNKSDLKKHVQADHGLTLFQYRSRYGPVGPRQKFK